METYIGVVTHYYNHLGVAVLSLVSDLRIDDTIHIRGATTDICQKNLSMEIDHQPVQIGQPREEVAVKMIGPVRAGDKVYLAPGARPMTREEVWEYDEWVR